MLNGGVDSVELWLDQKEGFVRDRQCTGLVQVSLLQRKQCGQLPTLRVH